MGNAPDRNREHFVPSLTLTGRIGFLTPLCFGHSCKAPRERRRALVAGVSELAGTWSEGSCGLRGSRRRRGMCFQPTGRCYQQPIRAVPIAETLGVHH